MSYYSGDFYAGARGRAMGDPGFFSFLGGLAGKIGGLLGKHPGITKSLPGVGEMLPMLKRGGSEAVAIAKRHPVMTAAGAAGILGAAGSATAMHMGGRRVRMGGGGGRHKRMRVTNPKALRRAIRRTQGFAKLAMRTIHLVHPKKKVRFGGFKKRRKTAA